MLGVKVAASILGNLRNASLFHFKNYGIHNTYLYALQIANALLIFMSLFIFKLKAV